MEVCNGPPADGSSAEPLCSGSRGVDDVDDVCHDTAPSSFLFLVVRPGAPSSALAPSSKARSS